MFRGRPEKLHDGSTDIDISKNMTNIDRFIICEEGEQLVNYTVEDLYYDAISDAVEKYEQLLDAGLAPEQARFVLPQGMITRWIWTGSLYG